MFLDIPVYSRKIGLDLINSCGSRPSRWLHSKHIFLMLLTVLKHGGQWERLTMMFRWEGPTFERMIAGFLNMVSGTFSSMTVAKLKNWYSMERIISEKNNFRHYRVDNTSFTDWRGSCLCYQTVKLSCVRHTTPGLLRTLEFSETCNCAY